MCLSADAFRPPTAERFGKGSDSRSKDLHNPLQSFALSKCPNSCQGLQQARAGNLIEPPNALVFFATNSALAIAEISDFLARFLRPDFPRSHELSSTVCLGVLSAGSGDD